MTPFPLYDDVDYYYYYKFDEFRRLFCAKVNVLYRKKKSVYALNKVE